MKKRKPAVFAVRDTYQIMVLSEEASMMWVKVGEMCYFDESNGILRSDTKIHKMIVPRDALDRAQEYTICERKIIERKPYFSETEDVRETVYKFYPVGKDKARAFHLADVHGNTKLALSAAKSFGRIDFLILNGDIIDHSGSVDNFDAIYEITEELTGGNIPVVFARGNHDLRGVCAEKLAEYTPTENGNSYYTVKLGSIWCVLLDCGEDKPDSHPEYGNTICCHNFRQRQTEYLNKIIENRENEYNADDIRYRMVISHIPFDQKRKPPFDIEGELYTHWCKLLKEFIKPDIMLSGHTHEFAVNEPGCEIDLYGQPCTVIVGSEVERGDDGIICRLGGTGLVFENDSIDISMVDTDGKVVYHLKISKKDSNVQ